MNGKSFGFSIIITMMIFCGQTFAQDSGFGLGIIVGEPTGVCGKLWLDGKTALDAAAAWSFEGESLHLHGDYLVHRSNVKLVEDGRSPWYYGIGLRLNLEEEDTKAGLRIPFGLDYMFHKAPLDLFFELVPILDLAPETDLSFNAAIGIRFFFK